MSERTRGGQVITLREVDCNGPGIRRRRAGRGFTYVDEITGERVADDDALGRIKALAIPPAWSDVWICPDPRGHIQAVGIDAKGRRQYRYHDEWRAERDREKHDRVVAMAKALPRLRARVSEDLRGTELTRPRVLAAAVRLLERGLFRVGGEEYASENESFGLATLQKRHVRVQGGDRRGRRGQGRSRGRGPGRATLVFDYPAKSGQRRRIEIDDAELVPVVQALKRRRRGGDDLLAYKDERGRWVDVRSEDVNDYLRAALGDEFSAKDVRTWGGTVLAAVALAAEDDGRESPSRSAVVRAMRRVARQLGNTPAVARSSYVDPRVVESYENGVTVDVDVEDVPEAGVEEGGPPAADVVEEVEPAVIDLIEDA